ncbi:MAG TPA: hypothetical protein VLX28_11890 [Thermoanaerobaculia bacterium]|nr:hypothetical protein [Thermoanaerobaculia bacterium]
MKKKLGKKAKLHRETLRQLTDGPTEEGRLHDVNGGVSGTCYFISVCQPCTLTHPPKCP